MTGIVYVGEVGVVISNESQGFRTTSMARQVAPSASP
jgi:hypothetical protein